MSSQPLSLSPSLMSSLITSHPLLPSLRLIDLSLDSSTIFRSKRNPTVQASPKETELPGSSPIKSRSGSPASIQPIGHNPNDTAPIKSPTRVSRPEESCFTFREVVLPGRIPEFVIPRTPQQPVAGPSKPRSEAVSRLTMDVEDVSDSQWDAAVQARASRKKQKRHKVFDTPSSPLPNLGVESSTPPQSSLRTPAPPSVDDDTVFDPYDDFDDPAHWPDSPPLPSVPMTIGKDSGYIGNMKAGVSRSVSPTKSTNSLGTSVPSVRDERNFERLLSPESDTVVQDSGRSVEEGESGIEKERKGKGKALEGVNNASEDGFEETLTLDMDINRDCDTLNKDNIGKQASLTDLFAGDDHLPPALPSPPPPSRATRSSQRASQKAREVLDLTNSDDDKDDPAKSGNHADNDGHDEYDDISFPDINFDLDYDNHAGPSTTPIRPAQQLTESIAEFHSSPSDPPPITHPIMLISDLPPKVQEFYNNHWRRGADKAKRKSTAIDDICDEEEEEIRPKRKAPPPKRGRLGGFRGRGRGFRGRGKGRSTKA